MNDSVGKVILSKDGQVLGEYELFPRKRRREDGILQILYK